jgi:L-lactate dehydrogenase complex protein LldE
MKVSLFIPCLVDQFFPRVGISLVKLFHKLGITVDYNQDQTCCGQPAFNSGYREEAGSMARHFLKVFEEAECIVTPSGSCCSMVKVFYPELFDDPGLRQRAYAIRGKIFEFSEFLVQVIGIKDVGARFPHRVTYHDSCHLLRELRVKEPPRILLQNVREIQLIDLPQSDQCCGFGGTFAIKQPEISSAMLSDKIQSILSTQAEYVVANDAGCLMNIGGWLSRNHLPVRPLHLAELLAMELFDGEIV